MTEQEKTKEIELVEAEPECLPAKTEGWGRQASFVVVSMTPVVWLVVSYLAAVNNVAGPDERILVASLTALAALVAYWTKKKSS